MEKKSKVKGILEKVIHFLYDDIGPAWFWATVIIFTGMMTYSLTDCFYHGKILFAHYSSFVVWTMIYLVMYLSSRLWFVLSKKRYCIISFSLILSSTFMWSMIDVLESRGAFLNILLYISGLAFQIMVYKCFSNIPIVLIGDDMDPEFKTKMEREIEEAYFQKFIDDDNLYNLDLEEYTQLDEKYHFSIGKDIIERARGIQHDIAHLETANALQVRYIVDQVCKYTDEWKDKEIFSYWKEHFKYLENRTRVFMDMLYSKDCLFIYLYVIYLCDEIPTEINIFDKQFALEQLHKKTINQVVLIDDVIKFLTSEMQYKNIPIEKRAEILKEVFDRSFMTEGEEKQLAQQKNEEEKLEK